MGTDGTKEIEELKFAQTDALGRRANSLFSSMKKGSITFVFHDIEFQEGNKDNFLES